MYWTKSTLMAIDNLGVGDLFLVIASIIGVMGSYAIYIQKRQHQRKNLRIGLIHELFSMEESIRDLDSIDRSSAIGPNPEVFFSDSVYTQNTDKLGLLTASEVDAIVNFYTSASVVHEAGEKDPGHVLIHLSNQELYLKLQRAIRELDTYVDEDFTPETKVFEKPTELHSSTKPF